MYDMMLAVILGVEAALKYSVVYQKRTTKDGLPGSTVCGSWYGRSYDMQDMLECGTPGFSVGNLPTESEGILPKGAPKDKSGQVNWSGWEGRAKVALDRANARRAIRHEQTPTFDEEWDFVEDSMDVDDTRWEQPGYALDPYWSTCPAVVEDQAITNSAVRWCEFDGEHRGPEAPVDYTALDKLTLDTLRQQWGHVVPRTTKGRRSLYLWGRGLKSLTEIESTNRVDYISRKGADDTAYMGHGRQSREDRFWRIVELFHRGEAALSSGDGTRGHGFLAWLVKRWGVDVETKISAGREYRKANADNKTLACGREYYLTYSQVQHLRGRRKGILRRYSHISGLTYDSGSRFIRAYSRVYWGLYSVSGKGFGMRGGVDFGVNPAPRPKHEENWPLSPAALEWLAEKKKRYTYTDGQKTEVTTRQVAVAHIIMRGRKTHTA